LRPDRKSLYHASEIGAKIAKNPAATFASEQQLFPLGRSCRNTSKTREKWLQRNRKRQDSPPTNPEGSVVNP
jgi:hypothetical protein